MLLRLWQITRLLHIGCVFLSLLSLWTLFLVATLNGHSCDFVVPQLLTHHRIFFLVHVRARSCDRDLRRLPELPESSSDIVNGSWITIGCIGWYRWRLWYWYRRRLWYWYRRRLWRCIGGVCGACAEGCTRSCDLDRCRCLPSCGD